MKYFKYYRLTTLMSVNRRNLGFSAIFVTIYIFITSTFVSENSTWVLGPSTLFIISIFIMSMYAHQMRFESTNPIYQFPLTIEERTKYGYITIFVGFFGVLLIMIISGFVLLGVLALTGNVNVIDGEEVTSSLWIDLYKIAHHLFIVAFMMPLSYIESKKIKYSLGLLSALTISLLHIVVYFAATGSFSISTSTTSEIINLPYYQFIVSSILISSIISLILLYKKSVKMNRYN